MKKELKAVIQPFIDSHGLILKHTKAHYRVSHPMTRQSVTVSVSPSDGRALANIRGDLRRLVGEKP